MRRPVLRAVHEPSVKDDARRCLAAGILVKPLAQHEPVYPRQQFPCGDSLDFISEVAGSGVDQSI
jgi:hypothetical protein